MAVEIYGILVEGLKKLFFEGLPGLFSSRLAYRLELEAHLHNEVANRVGNKGQPIIKVLVRIRNTGTKAEFLHQCGFDGLYQGSPCSTIVYWKQPEKLEERTFLECELRFGQNHEPVITALWVENALKKKWFLPKKPLKKLNSGLRSIVDRNLQELKTGQLISS